MCNFTFLEDVTEEAKKAFYEMKPVLDEAERVLEVQPNELFVCNDPHKVRIEKSSGNHQGMNVVGRCLANSFNENGCNYICVDYKVFLEPETIPIVHIYIHELFHILNRNIGDYESYDWISHCNRLAVNEFITEIDALNSHEKIKSYNIGKSINKHINMMIKDSRYMYHCLVNTLKKNEINISNHFFGFIYLYSKLAAFFLSKNERFDFYKIGFDAGSVNEYFTEIYNANPRTIEDVDFFRNRLRGCFVDFGITDDALQSRQDEYYKWKTK